MAGFMPYYDWGEVMVMSYERIRALREDLDWTQQHIADLLHVNRRTYSAYENGINAMSPEILSALADIHGTSVDYLLGRTDQKTPYPRKK
jgi:transcriptional regulator with XRE-family HTH domain